MKWEDNRGVYFMDGTVVVGIIVRKSQELKLKGRNEAWPVHSLF